GRLRFRQLHTLRAWRPATWGFGNRRISFLLGELVIPSSGRLAFHRRNDRNQNVSQRNFSVAQTGKSPRRLDGCVRNGDQGASRRFAIGGSADCFNRSSLWWRVQFSPRPMGHGILALVFVGNAQKSKRAA